MSEEARTIAGQIEAAGSYREMILAAQKIEQINDYGDLNQLAKIVKRRLDEFKQRKTIH